MKKVEQYEISDGKITRKRQFCPEESCGAGVFLADHKDRLSCGKCGYTKFKSDN
ncbi:MAG: 30S ribosomal protein S27ae [Candidatus Poseidoniia archaeon]|jgi:small subunit ribosomal protein S27Ae|nr:30S ribosomal protein S27ae [Candidatus Poseidoniia archaeon]